MKQFDMSNPNLEESINIMVATREFVYCHSPTPRNEKRMLEGRKVQESYLEQKRRALNEPHN